MIGLAKILLNLHPIDLMSLTWTSKAFRSFLLNRKLEWLWRRLYELNTAVPSCPEDMSPPEWTSLMFGEPVCQVSREAFRRSKETDNIQECGVNFAVCSFFLRKRVCDHCHVSWVPIEDIRLIICVFRKSSFGRPMRQGNISLVKWYFLNPIWNCFIILNTSVSDQKISQSSVTL